MRIKISIILSCLLLLVACSEQAVSKVDVPEIFVNVIPTELQGGLKLVEVKIRCEDCEPWREIEYYSNDSSEPIKREKVSVQTGYRAMYVYPGTEYFSNTKIEKSIAGNYSKKERGQVSTLDRLSFFDS
jgi:hypothetical protein